MTASAIRWTLADAWTLTLRGLQYWRREPTQIVAGLGFSIMLVVLFAFLFGGAMTVPGGGSYIEFLMPGMFVMTMAFGTGETMMAVTQDADKGVTDRFRSMPMSPLAVLLGRGVSDMLYATLGLAVMIALRSRPGLALAHRPGRGRRGHRPAAVPALRGPVGGHVDGPRVHGRCRAGHRPDRAVPVHDGHQHVRPDRDDAGLARHARRVEPAVGDGHGDARAVRQPGGRR